MLTIASYNIHKAVGADGRHNPERILDVLDELGAAVAILQEADTRFGVRTAVLPAALLASRGWQAAPLADQPRAMGWHGNAVLLRGPVTLAHAARIPLPALEPRGAVMVDIIAPHAPHAGAGPRLIRLVGAHLDLSGLWRTRQARAMLAAMAARPGNPPALLMGDLNEWRSGGGTIAALAGRLAAVPLPPSFPARLPIGRLDRVFAHHALKLAAAGVHASPLARQASDHLPIWVGLADD